MVVKNMTSYRSHGDSKAWIESFTNLDCAGFSWSCSSGNAGDDAGATYASDQKTSKALASAELLEELILAAVRCDGSLLKYAGDFRDDAETVVTATKNCVTAYSMASDRLRGDVRFVYRLLRAGRSLQQHEWLDEDGDVITFAPLRQERTWRFLDYFTGWQKLQEEAPEEAFALAHIALERGYRLRNLPLVELRDDPTLQEVDRLYAHHVMGPFLVLDKKTSIHDIMDGLNPAEQRAGTYEGFLEILDIKGLRAPPIPEQDDESIGV
ncbi:unnamed protein product [Amoebophrya sp. A25]|nr:unnamed protein product [Amoebophrya sp. A25]|eukprot:GSA25T00025326001.1